MLIPELDTPGRALPKPGYYARMMFRKSFVVSSISLAALALFAGSALAASPADTALLDQYEESVPTSEGAQGGSGPGADGSNPLPGAVQQGLYKALGKKDGAALERASTAARYGAPQSTLGAGSGTLGGLEPRRGNAVSDALSAIGGGGSRVLAVLLLLGIVTGSIVIASALRRRQTPA
jgi:hypothetical protein